MRFWLLNSGSDKVSGMSSSQNNNVSGRVRKILSENSR